MREIDLGSAFGAALLGALAERHGEALAKAARLPSRLFLIGSPFAPGLAFVGGEVDPGRLPDALPGPPAFKTSFSLAGTGQAVEDALASCIGECAERLSQIERPGDIVREGTFAETDAQTLPAAAGPIETLLRGSRSGSATPTAWVRGRVLATGGECLVPADWCLRRRQPGALAIPGAALSTGCAAGESSDRAAVRAVLELIERDAAALWWIGGQRPRPVAADSAAMAEAVPLLASLRRERRERSAWLLDIASDIGIPVVAAVSVDGDGRGLACGLAARLTPREAARAAVLEMCQMELALPVVAMKRRQRGEAALNDTDRRHLARAAGIDAGSCELIHPLGAPRSDAAATEEGATEPLAAVQAALARSGIEAALVDLTRAEIGIPVVSAVAPGLQLMPGDLTTPRLERAIAASGGGERFTRGLALF